MLLNNDLSPLRSCIAGNRSNPAVADSYEQAALQVLLDIWKFRALAG
jgi:hypothetical protein